MFHMGKSLIFFFIYNNRQGKNETWYLVKWCDLPYDQSTWEKENADLPEMSKHISQYEALRYVNTKLVLAVSVNAEYIMRRIQQNCIITVQSNDVIFFFIYLL